jgi:cobalt transporter subunit CbtB
MHSVSTPVVTTTAFARWPAALALAFGVLIVIGAGFAHPSAIHNATHDTRHAFGLPCH